MVGMTGRKMIIYSDDDSICRKGRPRIILDCFVPIPPSESVSIKLRRRPMIRHRQTVNSDLRCYDRVYTECELPSSAQTCVSVVFY